MGKHELIYGDPGKPIWESSANIRAMNHQAFDFMVVSNMKGIRYEDHAFTHVARQLGASQLALGPHISDAIFGVDTTPSWCYLPRPDGFIFNVDNTTWTLIAVVEMKSIHMKGLNDKIEGFSILLQCLRHDQAYFPNQLNRLMGDMIQMPQTILFPDDDKVTLHVISPYSVDASDITQENKFTLRYSQVSL